MGFVTPTGLPGEAFQSISGYASSQIGGLTKVLFRCRAIIFNCFALCDNLRRLSSPGKLPRVCVSYQLSASPRCSCDLRVAGKIFWSICIYLLNALVVNFWNLAALRRPSPKCGWLSLTFDMTKFYFSAIFRLKLGLLPWPSAVISIGCSLPNLSRFCYIFSGIA